MRKHLSIIYKAFLTIIGIFMLPFIVILVVDFFDIMIKIAYGDRTSWMGFSLGFYIIATIALILAVGVRGIRKVF